MSSPYQLLSPRKIRALPALLLTLSCALAACTAEQARDLPAAGHAGQPAAYTPPAAFRPISTAGCNGSVFATASSVSRLEAPKGEDRTRTVRYRAGENPAFARNCGWPVASPPPLPGSILPHKRVIAFYGNPCSKRMGILGEVPKEEMLRRLRNEVNRWELADPALPVQPALHLIAVVAQGAPGRAGLYRMILSDEIVNRVYTWAKEAGAIMIIDIQTGHDDIRNLLPRFEWLLKNPDVHLGIDPEFNMGRNGNKPGTVIGAYDAADVNYVSGYLRDLVQRYRLPPKVLIVHRFTRRGVTNARSIILRPEVQIVVNMDGWGPPWLKRDSYEDYVVAEPVQYTGFKLFYHNDTKKSYPLMSPRDLLKLCPQPLYVQYQ